MISRYDRANVLQNVMETPSWTSGYTDCTKSEGKTRLRETSCGLVAFHCEIRGKVGKTSHPDQKEIV